MRKLDIQTKTESELRDAIIGFKRESLNLQIQRINGQLQSPARFKLIRREIARIKTMMNQRSKASA